MEIIEKVLWATGRVEIDGDILPPNIVNKLEIFMLNVLGFKKGTETSDLIEEHDEDDVSLNRKIIKA
jgi:hypothetical protein